MSYICPKCNHTINISEEKLRALGYLTVCPGCLSTLKIIGNYAYIPTEEVPLAEEVSDDEDVNNKPQEQFSPLYRQAVEYLGSCNAISTPMLQAYFGISSEEAAELMRELERNGIVGPYRNGAPRKILIPHNPNLPSAYWHRMAPPGEDVHATNDEDEPSHGDENDRGGKTYGCTVNLSGCLTVLLIIMGIWLLIQLLN